MTDETVKRVGIAIADALKARTTSIDLGPFGGTIGRPLDMNEFDIAKVAIDELGYEKLVAFVREQQVEAFDALIRAMDRAIRHPWSIEVEGIIESIRDSAELVGPIYWGTVPWPIVRTGLYAAIFDHGTIDRPAPLTEKEYRSTDELLERHDNPARNQLCLALCAELVRRKVEGDS